MSSEMFYPSGDDVDRMIELAIQCGIDNRGTSWPLELCRVRAKLRALLARTEAGDEKVSGCEDCAHNGRYLCDTHGPQDASGDAERLNWLEAMANERGGLLLHDGSEAGRTGLGLRPGCLNRTLREAIDAAMQAKEAK